MAPDEWDVMWLGASKARRSESRTTFPAIIQPVLVPYWSLLLND